MANENNSSSLDLTELGDEFSDLDLTNANKKLAEHLSEIAAYYSLSRDVYRGKTFSEAAKLISDYPFTITSGAHAKETIPRVGPSTIQVIDQFLSKGTSKRMEELESIHKDRKETVDIFLQVYGIGPALANKYYDFGFRTLTDLWYEVPISMAAEFNIVVENINDVAIELGIIDEAVETEGDEDQLTILFYEVLRELARKNKLKYPTLTAAQRLGIQYFNDLQERIPRSEIQLIEEKLKTALSGLEWNIDWVIAGSYRRGELNSGDIDILIKSKPGFSLPQVVQMLTNEGLFIGDLARGPTKYMGILQYDSTTPARRVDLLVVPAYAWAYSILYFTGSQRFNVLSRQRAIELGFRLSEHGMTDSQGQSYPAKTEEDIFSMLGIAFLTPEERVKGIPSLTFE